MLARLIEGEVLLPPLVVRSSVVRPEGGAADGRLELSWRGESERFGFVVKASTKANPQAIQWAVAQARGAATGGDGPMIQVPFLSPEKLEELEKAGVSGVDLCGNGVIVVPGRLGLVRSGAPNLHPDSRPLNNPYRGRSSMVARMLLERGRWQTLSELADAVGVAGAALSLPQVSKAVQAMGEDLILVKHAREIVLLDPPRLLDHLGREWRRPMAGARRWFRLKSGRPLAAALSANPQLKWAHTGETSAVRHAMLAQGGPKRVAVSSLPLAQVLLEGTPEPIPGFADLELIETTEPGFYFGNETDGNGDRWASRLQCWLELQAGDARQQEIARDLRAQILRKAGP